MDLISVKKAIFSSGSGPFETVNVIGVSFLTFLPPATLCSTTTPFSYSIEYTGSLVAIALLSILFCFAHVDTSLIFFPLKSGSVICGANLNQ